MAEVMKRTKINELPSQAEEIDDAGLIVYTEDGSKVYCAKMSDFVAKVKELYSNKIAEDWINESNEESTETEHFKAEEVNGIKYLNACNTPPEQYSGPMEKLEMNCGHSFHTEHHMDTAMDSVDWINYYFNNCMVDELHPYIPTTPAGHVNCALYNKLYIDTVSTTIPYSQLAEVNKAMNSMLRNDITKQILTKVQIKDLYEPGSFEDGDLLGEMWVYLGQNICNFSTNPTGWFDNTSGTPLQYEAARNYGYDKRYIFLYSEQYHAIEHPNNITFNRYYFIIFPTFYYGNSSFRTLMGSIPYQHHTLEGYGLDTDYVPILHLQNIETEDRRIKAIYRNEETINNPVFDGLESFYDSIETYLPRPNIHFDLSPFSMFYGDSGIATYGLIHDGSITYNDINYEVFHLKGDYSHPVLYADDEVQPVISEMIETDHSAWLNWGSTPKIPSSSDSMDSIYLNYTNSVLKNTGFCIGTNETNDGEETTLNVTGLILKPDYFIHNTVGRTTKKNSQWTIDDESIFVGNQAYCLYILDQILNHGMSIDGKPYISSFTINGYDFTEQTQLSYQKQAKIYPTLGSGLTVYYDRTTHQYSIGLTQELYSQLQPALTFGDGIEYDEETGEVTAEGSCRDILVNGRTVVNPLNKTANISLNNLNLIQECQLQPGTNTDGHTVVAREMVEEFDTEQIRHTYYSYTIGLSSDIIPTEQSYYPSQVNIGPYEYGPYTVGSTQSLPSNESYVVIFDTVIVSPVDAAFCLFLKDSGHTSGYPFDPSNQYYDSDYVDFDIQSVKANVPTKFRIVKVVPATNDSPVTFASYQAAIMNTLPYSSWPLPSNIYAYGNTTVKKLINV